MIQCMTCINSWKTQHTLTHSLTDRVHDMHQSMNDGHIHTHTHTHTHTHARTHTHTHMCCKELCWLTVRNCCSPVLWYIQVAAQAMSSRKLELGYTYAWLMLSLYLPG